MAKTKTHCLYILIFFLSLTAFGQNQEEKIYNAIDSFTANPSAEALQNLRTIESDFWKNAKPKSKEDLLAIVILNCNKAYFENQFGENLKALKSYEKAWMVYEKNKLKNYDITEYCLKPLGNLYTVLGDYENAENTIKQYYFIASQEKNNSQKIAAILNLSNVYQNTGNIYKAIDLIEKTIHTEKLSAVQKGILLNNLGTNYMLSSKKKEAESSFLNAVSLLKNDQKQTETLANAYRNLAQLKVDQNDFKKASDFFEKAKTEFYKTSKREPRKIAQFCYEAAFISFSEGKLAEAQQNLELLFKTLIPNYSNVKNKLPNENSLYAETVLLDALDLQALLYLSENQPKNALKSYALSFKIEEMIQSLLVYENSKVITQVRNRNRTEKCIEIYFSLYEKEKKANYIESAFQLSEQTKSVVLKKHLKNFESISREEKLILQQLQNWNTTIIKEQQKLEAADISKINEAIKKQNELMLLLKTKQNKTAQKENAKLDLATLFEKLEKDNAVLIEYFFGSQSIYNFTLENKKIVLYKIKTDQKNFPELISFIGLFKDASVITNNPKKYNLLGNKVYQKLQIPAYENHKNLILVPDGILSFLPFEALIHKTSATSNFAKMHYLLDQFDIAYTNSAEFYLTANPLSKNKKNILGVFPIFEKTNYALRFSKNELQSVKHNFDGQFFENEKANFLNFKNNVTGKTIIHLSTHASSGDLETPASIKFYDQEILYSELYNLQLNPDLVVLSACETGIGKLYKAEGAMSVARGFQFAGAQNLLFSLWNVNDFTTSVFMDYFYKDLKHNSSFVHAASNAKRAFLKDENIPNAKKSPYYWSAFVYYGTLEEEAKPTNYIFYIISFLAVIGLFLVFNHYRKWKIFTKFSKSGSTKK